MSNATTLSDFCEAIVDCEHKTASIQDWGIPSIRTTNIKNGRIDFQNANRVSDEVYKMWTSRLEPQSEDLILAREAPVGEVGIIPKGQKACLGQRTVLIRPNKDKLNPYYLLYLLLTPEMRYEMLRRAGGSTVAHLNMSDIRGLEIPSLPPLPEQKVIARILGALDDKIELNQKMNQTLEAMAQAIFKSWFVDFDPVRAKMAGQQPVGMDEATAALFPDSIEDSELGEIPKGWTVTTLDNITDFVLGGDWGKDCMAEQNNEPAYCIRGADIPDLQNTGLGKMPLRYLKSSSRIKRSLESGNIVIEISGGSPTQSTGRPVLITDKLLGRLQYPLVCSNFCRMIRLKNKVSPSFVYLWLRWLYESDIFLQYENGTTGIKNLAYKIFSEEYKLVLPPDEILNDFEKVIQILWAKRDENGLQNQTLSTLRDTLLPKLMSGELRVPEADRQIAELV
jgi:type I restriction enzyme, S subunit